MNNNLSLVVSKALPGMMTESLTYNPAKNVFLTQGWTSHAGNTYYRAIRGANGIVIIFDLGDGFEYTFLNGNTIVGFDGQKPHVIAKREWGGCFDWIEFTERVAKQKTIEMLCDYLLSEAKRLDQDVTKSEVRDYAESLIEQTYRNRLA